MNHEKLLLHTCCAPCVCYVHTLLKEDYDILAFFYNPNIHPVEEYECRKNELIAFAPKVNLQLHIEPPDFEHWHELVKGYEKSPEPGSRCWICYQMRLEKTASYAASNNFDAFTTVLSISPHKNAQKINEIGKELAEKYSVKFIPADFKKNGGFQQSCKLSRQFNLYRQNYCGCEFSITK